MTNNELLFAQMPKFSEYNYDMLDESMKLFVNNLKNYNLDGDKSMQRLVQQSSTAIMKSPVGKMFNLPHDVSDIILKQYCGYNVKTCLLNNPELFWISWKHGEITDHDDDDDDYFSADSENTTQYAYIYIFKDGSYFKMLGSSITEEDDDPIEWMEFGFIQCGELKEFQVSDITHITRHKDGVFTRHENGRFGRVYFYQEWNFYNNYEDAQEARVMPFAVKSPRDIDKLIMFETK